MHSNTPSDTAITDDMTAKIERLSKQLDPVYPSVVVPAVGGGIDEPAIGYDEKQKPDFVRADDEGWTR